MINFLHTILKIFSQFFYISLPCIFISLPAESQIINRDTHAFALISDPNAKEDPDTGNGMVETSFLIGQYEVTNRQYVKFLNAVATQTDSKGLYNTLMEAHFWGGIMRSVDNNGLFIYKPKEGYSELPVTFVSWDDAARYVNWFHYGMPIGEAALGITEGNEKVGAYDISTAKNRIGLIRNNNARFWLPSKDEWAKAAFYNPEHKIWQNHATPENPINGLDAGKAGATFLTNKGWTAPFPHLTRVGIHKTAPGPWGTYDQAGNVMEWVEDRNGRQAALMGGSVFMGPTALTKYYFDGEVSSVDLGSFGFRIATSLDEKPLIPFSFKESQIHEPRIIHEKTKNITLAGIEFVKIKKNRKQYDPETGRGLVWNDFLIGQTEITNFQWATFINSFGVLAEEFCLYTPQMTNGIIGGITRIETGKIIKYQAKSGWENRPATYITWYAAARFSNWLHYQLSQDPNDNGSVDGTDVEGAYDTREFPDQCEASVTPEYLPKKRNSNALAFIPSINEWYLSAFSNVESNDNIKFWAYPTGSNSPPANTGSQAEANYLIGQTLGEGPPYYVSDVSAYIKNPRGTFGQAGNLWEWLEDWRSTGKGKCWRCDEWVRSLAGGSFNYSKTGLHKKNIDPGAPNQSYPFYGLRIAASSKLTIYEAQKEPSFSIEYLYFKMLNVEARSAYLFRRIALSDWHRTTSLRIIAVIFSLLSFVLLLTIVKIILRISKNRQ